jgi:threonine/homoserine/homoserine lactone efflux protein
MAFILGSALTGGRRHGFAAVCGAIAGAACHSVIATLGAAIALEEFPRAFHVLLIAGACYIAWLGIGILRSPARVRPDNSAPVASTWQTFRRELANNMLNPNAYMFSLAVFPQFLLRDAGPITLQACVLFLIIAVTQASVYGTLVLVAAQARHWLATQARAQRNVSRMVGLMLILVAALAGIAGWQRF